MFNAYWGAVQFTLPAPPSGSWTIVLDTMSETGSPVARAPLAAGASIAVGGRAVVIATS